MVEEADGQNGHPAGGEDVGDGQNMAATVVESDRSGEVGPDKQMNEQTTTPIGLGISQNGRHSPRASEGVIVVKTVPPSPGAASVPAAAYQHPPTLTSSSSTPSPDFVPFKLKRSSVSVTSPPVHPANGTTSPPPSAYLSPTSITSPGDWPSAAPEGHDATGRRTSIVFGNTPIASVPSPRRASFAGSSSGDADQEPSRSNSTSPIPFESITLSDDTNNAEAHDSSSPFVYASPAVAHSIKEKRSSWSNPSVTAGPSVRSTTPRTSGATEGSGEGEKPKRPLSWMARTVSGGAAKSGSGEQGLRRSSQNSRNGMNAAADAAGPNEDVNYNEPEPALVTTNGPKPRIHAPPAIPHSANPAIARAMSPSNASGQTSLSSNGHQVEEKPKRKFVLYRLHGKDKDETNGSQSPAHTRPQPQNATAGPSKLEQVRSHTRPIFLPPKPKEEDEKHLKDWEDIMDAARHADAKREAILEKARLEKEARMAENLPTWEALLADDKVDIRERVNGDPKLKAMWFEGVPSHMRGKLWSRCIGNPLAMSKDAFNTYNSRAQRAVKAGRFPSDVLERIEQDSASTLPVTKLFQAGSPMQEELRDLLLAWFVSRFDEGLGYTSNVRHIAGMLLLTMNLSLAFVALRNLLDRSCLRAFYCGLSDEVEAYYRIFDNLQGELFPKIYANCKHLGVRLPSSYFTTIFLHQLSYETANRVWDLVMLDGDGHVFRVALAILAILEPRLYFPDRKEITSVLEGNNPASMAIIAREKERAKQRGQIVSEEIDGVLTALGVNESTLFEALAMVNWKESRFNRLSQRELPD